MNCLVGTYSRILIGFLILCFVIGNISSKSRGCKRQSILTQPTSTTQIIQTAIDDVLVTVPLSLGLLVHLSSVDIAIWRHLSRLYELSNCTAPSQRVVGQIQQSYLEDFATSSDIILQNWYEKVGPSAGKDLWIAGTEVVKNPVAVVRLMYRLVHLLQPLVLQLKYGRNVCPENELVLQRLTFLFHGLPMPTVDDLNEIVTSFLNLQQIYDLNPADLADGKVGMMETNIRLSAEQALLIGKKATQEKQYSLARPWLLLAHIMFQGSSGYAIKSISAMIREHDAHLTTLAAGENVTEKMQRYLFEEPLSKNFSARTIRGVQMEKYEGTFLKGENSFDSEAAYYNYLAVCRHGKTAVYKSTKEVYCYLDTRKHRYLSILPAKVEILSHDPYVVVFRDAIPPSLIEPYRRDALTQFLNPSQRVSTFGFMRGEMEKEGGLPINSLKVEEDPRPGVPLRIPRVAFRRGYHTYPQDELFDIALNQRVELLTGLLFRQPNSTTVSCFIHGEHPFIHVDGTANELGMKLASILIFMTSVEEGGALAFNNIGLRVPPRLGDMVFWYNLFPNGSFDYRLSHEGCSPLNGVRLIAAKFAWTLANTFVEKCPTEEAHGFSLRRMNLQI